MGRQWINRGMGRYTQQQLAAVLQLDHDNDYLLLCPEQADETLILRSIRRAPNAYVCRIPRHLTDPQPDGQALRLSEAYQQWLAGHQLDVYHATTPFANMLPVVPTFDVVPLVTTLYDLIPLRFSEHYGIDHPSQYRAYMCSTTLLTKADRILAISAASGRDGHTHLGLSPAICDVAYPVADACFHPLDRDEALRRLEGLGHRFRPPQRFALVVSAEHHSKNIDTLLRAYAMLPAARRLQMPLVFGGKMGNSGSKPHLLSTLDIVDDVLFTGLLSDRQLAALYNLATFVVHPSLYEGFGLPVLEAIQCGTPVITTTASSLPEVAGDAALLVDPHDAGGMARAMETMLDNSRTRQELRDQGLQRSRAFSSENLAKVTLGAYRATAAAAAGRHSARPRIAVWTPLPPQQTGISDFSVELLHALSGSVDVEIFVDDDVTPDVDLMIRWPVHHHSAFDRRRRQAPFDAVIYQLGASTFHTYMYGRMQQLPGVVDLHDLSWNRVLYYEALVSGSMDRFEAELGILEGEHAVTEFRAAHTGTDSQLSARVEAFLDAHPMLGRVIDSSLAQIVHFPAAKDFLGARYPRSRARVVPMGVADPLSTDGRTATEEARVTTSIDPATFVVGVLGMVDSVKCIDLCLRSFAQLVASRPDSLLTIVGGAWAQVYMDELCQLVDELGIARAVRFTGRVPRQLFDAHLLACDVVVALRYPSRGQMSAIVMRAAAAAKPLIVSDIADWAFLPDDFCWRLPHGPSATADLAGQLARLSADEQVRASMAAAARRFYEAEGTLATMARRYLEVIQETL